MKSSPKNRLGLNIYFQNQSILTLCPSSQKQNSTPAMTEEHRQGRALKPGMEHAWNDLKTTMENAVSKFK